MELGHDAWEQLIVQLGVFFYFCSYLFITCPISFKLSICKTLDPSYIVEVPLDRTTINCNFILRILIAFDNEELIGVLVSPELLLRVRKLAIFSRLLFNGMNFSIALLALELNMHQDLTIG